MSLATHKLFLVFIHGFKGDDKTFKDLPVRLVFGIDEYISKVYPSYETSGDLKKAVEKFCDWLEDEVETYERKGNTIWVCLLGHSMGGILAADAILRFRNLPGKKPRILGLIAYDTPFYGLNKDVFSGAYTRAVDYTEKIGSTVSLLSGGAMLAQSFWNSNTKETKSDATSPISVTKDTTETVTTSTESDKISKKGGYSKWAMGLAAVTAATTVGALTYAHKDKLERGMSWIGSHMQFVGVLIKDQELKERVEELVRDPHLIFHCFYVYIPPKKKFDPPCTFIRLPPTHMRRYFSPCNCTIDNEIEAHMSMFDGEKNHSIHILVTHTKNFLNKMAAKFEY